MEKYLDKALLLTFALLLAGADAGFPAAVVPLLVAVSLAALTSAINRPWAAAAAAAGFLLLCVFLPKGLYFFPLAAHDLNKKPLYVLYAGELPFFFFSFSPMQSAMIAALSALSVVSGLRLAALDKARSRYYNYYDASRESDRELKQKNQELAEKQYYRMETARLEERNRIAREIHDSVGHVLTSCILQTGALIATEKDETVKASLTQLKQSLTEGMNSIRASVHGLHEEIIDLEKEIHRLVSEFRFCRLDFTYRVDSVVKKPLSLCLIAAVKECLSNIIKHSGATEASVTVREHPAFFQLAVRDNGASPSAPAFSSSAGLGLAGMEERVRALGGYLNVTAENGFQVYLTLPKETPK